MIEVTAEQRENVRRLADSLRYQARSLEFEATDGVLAPSYVTEKCDAIRFLAQSIKEYVALIHGVTVPHE